MRKIEKISNKYLAVGSKCYKIIKRVDDKWIISYNSVYYAYYPCDLPYNIRYSTRVKITYKSDGYFTDNDGINWIFSESDNNTALLLKRGRLVSGTDIKFEI